MCEIIVTLKPIAKIEATGNAMINRNKILSNRLIYSAINESVIISNTLMSSYAPGAAINFNKRKSEMIFCIHHSSTFLFYFVIFNDHVPHVISPSN